MKYSYIVAGLLLFGMFGLVFVVMFESITINNESEYYVLKEAMEAAMLESVDIDCFRNSTPSGCNGKLKISEQRFVENFTRRFAASINGDVSEYTLEFYDIMESPPKASIKIIGSTSTFKFDGNQNIDANIVNNLSGILEIDRMWVCDANNENCELLETGQNWVCDENGLNCDVVS